MAAGTYNIDDPQNINSFLAMLGGSQISVSSEPNRSAVSEPFQVVDYSKAPNLGIVEPEKETFGSVSRSEYISASPVQEVKAPPSTPATGAVTSDTAVMPLEPIQADGSDVLRKIAESSNLSLNDSIYATKNYKRKWVSASKRTSAAMPARRVPLMSFSNPFAVLEEDKATGSPRNKTTQEKLITNYQDEVIAKFVKEKVAEVEKKPELQTEPFPALEDMDTEFVATPESTDKVTQSTVETPEASKPSTGNPKMVVTPASDDVNTSANTHNDFTENREQLQHFSSWGAPTPRFRPAARIRKIMLSNLPAESDLTLIQSLVYGGAIETFNLSTNKTSAYVIFVSADACDAYFNAHPNGIVFRNPKTRRNHTVFVDKGHDVDIVSGVLQAYLDCQASRVVRATGADEDWGMRALYKLAESKNRKVETIVDTYRDKIRTIIFRFTNIADAVTFRGQLLRDAEWEMCNIQFVDDPAEKATGVHLED